MELGSGLQGSDGGPIRIDGLRRNLKGVYPAIFVTIFVAFFCFLEPRKREALRVSVGYEIYKNEAVNRATEPQ